MARGDGGKQIFIRKEDHESFLHWLERVCASHGWRAHAWVLMGNHPAYARSYGGQVFISCWSPLKRICLRACVFYWGLSVRLGTAGISAVFGSSMHGSQG